MPLLQLFVANECLNLSGHFQSSMLNRIIINVTWNVIALTNMKNKQQHMYELYFMDTFLQVALFIRGVVLTIS